MLLTADVATGTGSKDLTLQGVVDNNTGSPHSIPSKAARARFSRVIDARVSPVSEAVACGRLGVRSPSK